MERATLALPASALELAEPPLPPPPPTDWAKIAWELRPPLPSEVPVVMLAELVTTMPPPAAPPPPDPPIARPAA